MNGIAASVQQIWALFSDSGHRASAHPGRRVQGSLNPDACSGAQTPMEDSMAAASRRRRFAQTPTGPNDQGLRKPQSPARCIAAQSPESGLRLECVLAVFCFLISRSWSWKRNGNDGWEARDGHSTSSVFRPVSPIPSANFFLFLFLWKTWSLTVIQHAARAGNEEWECCAIGAS